MKPTNKELEERIELVAQMITKGWRTSQIKAGVRAKFGQSLDQRTIGRYMARARDLIMKQCDMTKDQMRAESFEFYAAVIRDGKSTMREKMQARERIDKLFGLEAPTRQEVSGPGGKPISMATKQKEPIDFNAVMAEFQSIAGTASRNGN